MKNKILIIILVGITTVTGLVLAMYASPLRKSFDEYAVNYTNRIINSTGIDFSDIIGQERYRSLSKQYEGYYLEMTDLQVNSGISEQYIADNNSGSGASGASYNSSSNSKEKSGNDLASGMGESNGFSARRATARNSDNSNGITTIPTNAVATNKTITPTRTNYSQNSGGTFPGIDPKQNELIVGTLPVGNGSWALLLMAMFYGIWKVRKSM